MSRSSRKANYSPEAWERRLAHNRAWCKAHRVQINAQRMKSYSTRKRTDRQKEQDRLRMQRKRDRAKEAKEQEMAKLKEQCTPEEWVAQLAKNAKGKRNRNALRKAAGCKPAAKPEDAKLHKMELEQAQRDRLALREKLRATRFYRPFEEEQRA